MSAPIERKADAKSFALTKAIVLIGKTLGMKVVAEVVETREQLGSLAAMGCDFVQGYLVSKPVPAADFGRMPETPAHWVE